MNFVTLGGNYLTEIISLDINIIQGIDKVDLALAFLTQENVAAHYVKLGSPSNGSGGGNWCPHLMPFHILQLPD